MAPRTTGTLVPGSLAGDRYQCYVPAPLPPKPPLERDGELDTLHERASVSLGRLDGLSRLLPDPEFFLYGYVRKEALLSSQIEGTQSSFSDLLLYEAKEVPGVPLADVEEVSRYVAALEYGLRRLREGFPLSLRLIRGIHGELLRSGRGAGKQPGEFRTAQNWVGGAKPSLAAFVPPPPDRLMDCLDAFERFLHQDDQPMPSLIRAALAHAQFETIHPFLEGNGRIGRLLITLLLCTEDMISQPTLYLSLHFKTYRADYYDWLQRVRRTGDWEGWVKFFLKGVIATSDQAVETAHRIQDLFKEDQQKVETLGRASGSALRLFQELQRRPLQTIGLASRSTGLSAPTVTEALLHLVRLGIVEEVTGRKRRRIYVYRRYLKELEQGTEPPGREGAGSVPTQRTTAPSRDPA